MMKDRSTKTWGDFLFSCGLDLAVAVVWFYSVLFRTLPGMTFGESRLVFCSMAIAGTMLGVLLVFRRRRTEWTALACVLLPCGAYLVMTYRAGLGNLPAIVLSAAAVLAAGNTLHVLARKIRSPNRAAVLKNRLYHCLCTAHSFLSLGMAALFLVLVVPATLGMSLVTPSVQAQRGSSAPGETIAANMDAILLLQDQEWEALGTRERLDVMQTVANIEAHYLGLPNELNVGVSNLPEDTLGNYSDATRTISLDLELLAHGSSGEVLDALCHEAYHSYQHRLVDAYRGAGESLGGLRLFGDAAVYAEEFADYEEGASDETFYAYYTQRCEADARSYAAESVTDYFQRLRLYLDEQG